MTRRHSHGNAGGNQNTGDQRVAAGNLFSSSIAGLPPCTSFSWNGTPRPFNNLRPLAQASPQSAAVNSVTGNFSRRDACRVGLLRIVAAAGSGLLLDPLAPGGGGWSEKIVCPLAGSPPAVGGSLRRRQTAGSRRRR